MDISNHFLSKMILLYSLGFSEPQIFDQGKFFTLNIFY